MSPARLPPLTASIGQACYKCFRDESDQRPLSRCSQCHTVAYCGSECQKADWASHKHICKAFHSLENDVVAKATLTVSLSHTPTTNTDDLNDLCTRNGHHMVNLIQGSKTLKRALDVTEKNLIGWEPKCLACARTDRIIRMEKSPLHLPLKSCPECRLVFYCSQEHWDAVRTKHTSGPCEDSQDGMTQCQMNQAIRMDVVFANIMAGAPAPHDGPFQFQWAPERTKSRWEPLKAGTWEEEFGPDVKAGLGDSASLPIVPFLRASSEGLSMPMTILYALQHLNDTDKWTTQETLTIHVLGAYQLEVNLAQMFEEILHRLPKVKTLKITLCGPQLKNLIVPFSSRPMDMDTCPDCQRNNRKRIHEHRADTYHEYAERLGRQYVKPDLAIAFNSGASQNADDTWKKTIQFLVREKIATAFTSYNSEEAIPEAKMLEEAGAKLVPALGPVKNPWGSSVARPEPNRVTGFYSTNGWLCGGFR